MRIDIGTNGNIESRQSGTSAATSAMASANGARARHATAESNEGQQSTSRRSSCRKDLETVNSNCRLSSHLPGMGCGVIDPAARSTPTWARTEKKAEKRQAVEPDDADDQHRRKLDADDRRRRLLRLQTVHQQRQIDHGRGHRRPGANLLRHPRELRTLGRRHPGATSPTTPTSPRPATTRQGQYEVPGLYLIGLPTISTNIDLSGNSSGPTSSILYAPYSDIEIGGNATCDRDDRRQSPYTLDGNQDDRIGPGDRSARNLLHAALSAAARLRRVHGRQRLAARRQLLSLPQAGGAARLARMSS